MDKPKAPDDARDWDFIDIYLFTNGQDCSPPRKYHLKTEEIKWWDETLNLLANSQFGSLQSNIELYTLDGKKIKTPLELKNDAPYVAVKPPDTFVQTGYEKYLLKASRSWEKRHERLNNNKEGKSEKENIAINGGQMKSNVDIPNDGAIIINDGENTDSILLDTKIGYLAKVQNNTFGEPQKDAKRLQHSEKTHESVKTAKPQLLQRRKPESNTSSKDKILKKICPNSKSKEDGRNLNKKRTTYFPKNLIKTNNNRNKSLTSTNNTNILNANLVEVQSKVKSIEEPRISNIKTLEHKTETKEETVKLPNHSVVKTSPGTFDKDFMVLSDIYKNTESDIQSVFLDADRKIALLSNEQRMIPGVLENIDELREIPDNDLKTNMANSQQRTNILSENIQSPNKIQQPGTFNINLNIDFRGCTVLKTKDTSQANNCKTSVTMKPEKSSQVNVDDSLSRELFNELMSAESGIAKPCDEKFADNKTKVIVHCKCNLIKSDISPPYDINENEHNIIIIPRSDLETHRGSVKEIQEFLHSIRVPISSNSVVSNKKLENVTKRRVSISQEAPKELNFDSMQLKSQGDIHTQNPSINDTTIDLSYKIDNFAQTDWCDTLVQAKCHEDGRYTFHLPPLELLKQYNLI
ncbi:uncharacterized protein LOC123864775 [Maniola jurtina]|uniref:uncharacterized protein LOC123864775 n=1 Tax=Maniola jurtina TaxID=191418 RepID=UPI001E686F1F|nr:uncharacterized protein LOC123864775 [Maniola jurtina]